MEQTAKHAAPTKQAEFGWIDLAASDLEAQTKFYETLFGWTHEDVSTQPRQVYRLFSLNGAQVAGASPMTSQHQFPARIHSTWNTYITVGDLDEVVASAAQLGAKIIVPPMDVMSRRIAGVQDPTGAVVYFRQPSSQDERFAVGELGTLMWSDLNTSDPQAAMDFYSKLLGWDVKPSPTQSGMPYWMIEVAGEQVGGITRQRTSFMPRSHTQNKETGDAPSWLVYFGVPSASEAARTVRAENGAVLMEPMDVGPTTFATFADPGGAVFTVMEPVRQP
ncbi:MAG TPA: VOC family protein [Coriobacteriia bacterium]|nr:VOC family protein [Coriobacteriia bacterium]